jgi:MoxR-like ATPase
VIATQNPSHQIGTFPLPESQLDRFLMRIQLGYPGANAERALLLGQDRRDLLENLGPALAVEELAALQQEVRRIHVAPALLDYVQALVEYTRTSPEYTSGLSPRAALAMLHAARAWALMDGRRHVVPEDVQIVLPGVVSHRLGVSQELARVNGRSVAEHLIKEVAIP